MKTLLFSILFFSFATSLSAAPMDISQTEINALMSGASIEGSLGANITLIEYSDMECPFCIRLHNEIQLWKKIQNKYGTRVNYIFKNNRGVNHTGTEKKALSAICIKKLGGDRAYIDFYNQVLSLSSSSRERTYSIYRIPTFLRKQKISIPDFNTCTRDPATLDQFDRETKEAVSYDLGGTPGILIINTKTLKYDTVLGAYPINHFITVIDSLLGDR